MNQSLCLSNQGISVKIGCNAISIQLQKVVSQNNNFVTKIQQLGKSNYFLHVLKSILHLQVYKARLYGANLHQNMPHLAFKFSSLYTISLTIIHDHNQSYFQFAVKHQAEVVIFLDFNYYVHNS